MRLRLSKVVSILVLAIIAIPRLLFIVRFNDLDWEPDSYLHFLQALTVFENFPANLNIGLEVWAKPLYTYIAGAWLMLTGGSTLVWVQIFNILVGLISLYLVHRILRKLEVGRKLSIFGMLLTSFSFIFFRSSVSALTEPIFTLVLLLSIYNLAAKRNTMSAFWAGLLSIGRLEGLLFTGLIGLYLIWQDRKHLRSVLRHIFLLITPVLLWNFLGFLTTGQPLFLITSGYPTIAGTYGYGGLFHYAKGFLMEDPVISVIGFSSILLLAWQYRHKFHPNPQLLICAIISIYFLVQTFLYYRGLFGTAGLMRYFVPVMPLLAIVAAIAINSFKSIRLKNWAIGIVLILQIGYSIYMLSDRRYLNGLYTQPGTKAEYIETGNWIRSNTDFDTKLHTDKPEIAYYAGRTLQTATINLSAFKNLTPGIYAMSDWAKFSGIDLNKIESNPQVTLLYSQLDTKVYLVQ